MGPVRQLIKWFLLCIVTIGFYGFWVGPRIARWTWEHTAFEAPVHTVRPRLTPPPGA